MPDVGVLVYPLEEALPMALGAALMFRAVFYSCILDDPFSFVVLQRATPFAALLTMLSCCLMFDGL